MKNEFRFLDFTPNPQQKVALENITSFIKSNKDVFILKGSAGTGKTTIVKAITSYLSEQNIHQRFAAPTARAASVMSDKTDQQAKTMHSQIYTPEQIENGEGIRLNRKNNTERCFTVFFVDEASMISNILSKSGNFFVLKPLLDDYINYVKQGNSKNKIIFIGDAFQLPPIGQDFSPSLNSNYLKKHFGLNSVEYELTQVMRQEEGSNILEMATHVRDAMKRGLINSQISIDREASPFYAMKRYLNEFDFNNHEKVIAICASNHDVSYWNLFIRNKLGLSSSPLKSKDFVVTQSTWLNNNKDWVYKGEYGKIIEVDNSIEKFANLEFINAKIAFPSSAGSKKIITTKVLLDSLKTKYGILKKEQEKHLYAEVMKRNPKFRATLNNADDKYLGAIRLKHSYATTCHKAQGGEWDNVLIHPWKIGIDLPWTYTALTRAKKDVYSYAA